MYHGFTVYKNTSTWNVIQILCSAVNVEADELHSFKDQTVIITDILSHAGTGSQFSCRLSKISETNINCMLFVLFLCSDFFIFQLAFLWRSGDMKKQWRDWPTWNVGEQRSLRTLLLSVLTCIETHGVKATWKKCSVTDAVLTAWNCEDSAVFLRLDTR
jgi:hypothetical protein